MFGWLSDLFKSGPIHKHWWRERANGSYKIVASIYGDGVAVNNITVAHVTFDKSVPIQSQHAAMARIVKGLDN